MERGNLNWTSFDFSNETEFEEMILRKSILKDYTVYDSKKTLNIFRNYNRYADILLVQKDYMYWCIGEVEISKHSFKSHVFPQLVEIYSLMNMNIDLIRQNVLSLEAISLNKEIIDLVNFNKPYLSLVIDKIPSHYRNIIPLLNSFCNINLVERMKDENENYSYRTESYYLQKINNFTSDCYINNVVLIIDNPNLLGMNKTNFNYLEYKGEKILMQQHFNLVDGQNRLYWILDKKINDGKYYITNSNNKLTLNKNGY